MRKPNYSQDRAQRERDKAAKAQAKELKKQEQKAAAVEAAGKRGEGQLDSDDFAN